MARYFAKTAIGNERILSCDDEQVAFKWRDYSDNSKSKIMTLDAHEFIRRYLSHILPDGFMRVRSFGFLANACKTKNIATIRTLLHDEQMKEATAVQSIASAIDSNDIDIPQPLGNLVVAACSSIDIGIVPMVSEVIQLKAKESVAELIKRITGIDIEICKHCKLGRLEKIPLPPCINQAHATWDTS